MVRAVHWLPPGPRPVTGPRACLTGAFLALGLAGIPLAASAGPAAPAGDDWRAPFAAAVALHRAGDWRAAAPALGAVAGAPTPIPEHALYLQADSLARLGDAAAARAAALEAVDKAGDGPLAPGALLLAAGQAAAAGDHAGAATLYRRFLDRYPDHAEATAAGLAIGEALDRIGQSEEAARVFGGVRVKAPASALAEEATRRRRELAARGVPVPPLTLRERLERAERLLAAGVITSARTEGEAILADAPPSDVALRTLRVVAEAWRRAGRADEALRAVERAVTLAPPDQRAPWLLERARLLDPKGRPQALAALDGLVRDHPKSAEAPEALLLKAQWLEGSKLAEAEAVYVRLAADYPTDGAAGRALWRLGWLSWFRSAFREAGDRWGRILAVRGGQAYRDAATYWLGRAHAVRGETAEAARHWGTLLADVPRSYYGVLALQRVGSDTRPPPRGREGAPAVVSLPADPLEPLRLDPRWGKVEALRAVGLSEFADSELTELGRRAAGDLSRLYAVSAAWAQARRYHLSLRILRRDFVPLARTGDSAAPRVFWEMFHPLGWRSDLEAAAGRAALDPLLVAAVVREESSFDPSARSRVGARGLMQLMPATARPMARARGWPFADGDLLDEPAANLDLGSTYLAGLKREFGDPRLAVAAYNAGPGRVREWWAGRRSDDLEVWVEQIPFNETRGFVKRVMFSWQEYQRLYGGEP